MTLFGDISEDGRAAKRAPLAPLAERMRPADLDEYLGQDELLGEGRALRAAIEQGVAGSLLLVRIVEFNKRKGRSFPPTTKQIPNN